MKYKEYETYANKAGQLAETNFATYKLKVIVFAILGYTVIVGVVVLLLGITGGLIAASLMSTAILILLIKKKLILIILPMIWILCRSLWVKLNPPTGYSLSRRQFPELFAVLDELILKLRSLKIHEVILTGELNASVVQTPRFGMLGFQKNTLVLGLELLLILSPRQAKAVIAHELGHLSGNHSRFNGWIYRVRESWYRLLEGLSSQNNSGAVLMDKFFSWYAPRFSAFSFPLARYNEYEADKISAELTTPEDAAAALVNTHVTAPYIDKNYWNVFFSQADEQAVPNHLPWQGLHDFLLSGKDNALDQSLARSLTEETSFNDTHPSLRDRLSALNVEVKIPEPVEISAAQELLGHQYESVIADFDQEWQESNLEKWKQRYEYVTQSKKDLTKLKEKSESELSDQELWRLGRLNEEFSTLESAVSTFRAYQKRYPEDRLCAFVLGRNLYYLKDEQCIEEFERSAGELSLAYDSCLFAYHFLIETKQERLAEQWLARAEKARDEKLEAAKERKLLNVNDTLKKPDMEHNEVVKLLEKLSSSCLVKKA